MSELAPTDGTAIEAVIVGAGPTGLWTAFQLGIHGVRCLIVDASNSVGGQCAAFYADKPIYDLPGFAAIDAGEFIGRLSAQLHRFEPVYRFGCRVSGIRAGEADFLVATADGERISSSFVIVATGLGPLGMEGKPPAIDLDAATRANAGLFVVGDAVDRDGRLPLLTSGFQEASAAAFAIRGLRSTATRQRVEYSSTSSSLRALFTAR